MPFNPCRHHADEEADAGPGVQALLALARTWSWSPAGSPASPSSSGRRSRGSHCRPLPCTADEARLIPGPVMQRGRSAQAPAAAMVLGRRSRAMLICRLITAQGRTPTAGQNFADADSAGIMLESRVGHG